MIFNTSTDAPYPIHVCLAEQFGGKVTTEIPVVLAYNQYHYESLHPTSFNDILKTINLVNDFVSGQYGFKRQDIPYLVNEEEPNVLEESTTYYQKDQCNNKRKHSQEPNFNNIKQKEQHETTN